MGEGRGRTASAPNPLLPRTVPQLDEAIDPLLYLQDTSYICEFGDAMIEGTGLDGSATIYESLRAASFVADKMLADQATWLNMLTPASLEVVAKSLEVRHPSNA